MPLISIAGGALFAERLGSGPPRVLALHGWGRRGADLVPALTGLDAICLDLPGFGASPPPPAPVGAAGYADAIGPVFDLFNSPPVVVGHSFGGRVAVARQHGWPGSTAGLVLVGSPLVRRSDAVRRRPPLAFRAARLANRWGLISEDAMERRRRRHGSADYRAATGVMRDILVMAVNESYEKELADLGIPVKLLWGENDTEVPVSVAEAAADLIRRGGAEVELEVLAGVGHHVPLAAPDRLREAVERMLAQVGR
ncbi:MAG TPA: alpha/beta hydrolase [Acidimicrobiia bacterium]|nr:alpha/beta hydrolase [Acidimicrobiia bacterium]